MAGFDNNPAYVPLSYPLSEIRDYVDIIYTYCCKLCDFSSANVDSIWHHVVESHLHPTSALGTSDIPISSAGDAKLTSTGVDVSFESANTSRNAVKELGSFQINAGIKNASNQCISSALAVNVNSLWKTVDVCSIINSQLSSSDEQVSKLNQGQIMLQSHVADLDTDSVAGRYIQGENRACSEERVNRDDSVVIGFETKNNTVKEVFVCSSCGTGFTSEGIIEHMINVHGMKVESQIAEEVGNQDQNSPVECANNNICPSYSASEIQLPPNVTSTGTQVQLVKKPGRKRKVVGKSKLQTPEIASASDRESENAKAIGALSIERVMGDDNVDPCLSKRQIRPPRMLVKDYHIVFHKHWKRHSASPDNAHNVKCKVIGCDAILNSEDDLAYHSKCHAATSTAELQYSCPECRRPFQVWNKLQVHIQTMHNISFDGLDCSGCDFRAKTASLLEEHNMAVHSGEMICNSTRKSRNSGSKISRRVAGKKTVCSGQQVSSSVKNECSLCKRQFANRKSLHTHIEVVHDKLKMFMCSICGYNSARKATLQLHMRIHTGEKPYRCDMCLFSASDHNTLRRHRMRHTGQKSYGCSFCTYTCIQAASLKLHIRSKHPNAATQPVVADAVLSPKSNATFVYTCSICRYQTVNQRSYKSHVINHGIVPSSSEVCSYENNDVATGEQSTTQASSIQVEEADSPTPQTGVVDTSYQLYNTDELSSQANYVSNSKVYTVMSYQVALD